MKAENLCGLGYLEVLTGLDDGRLTEPRDLWTGAALNFADELHLRPVRGRQGLDLFSHLGREGCLALAWLCER